MTVESAKSMHGEGRPRPWIQTLIVCGLVALTAAVYAPVREFEFVNFDDDAHVYMNRHVTFGLTSESVAWAFGIHGPSQWHPLAWISHQIDCELFALWPGGHHLTNAALHAGNVVLLYLFLTGVLSSTWRSALVAAVFAVHPLNVESVAWVSERRNVLSLFLGLLTMITYVRYVRLGGGFRYASVVFVFALALMAKPLMVTLPCVLLLLDFWPLRRLGSAAIARGPSTTALNGVDRTDQRPIRPLVIEKTPLLLLSAAASVLTVWCQEHALVSRGELPIGLRLLNALAAYGWYLVKIVWPTNLGVFYPHPGFTDSDPYQRLLTPSIVGGLLLATISVAVLLTVRRRPCLVVGWLWFLGTLVPMIGVWQVGQQQMADRYAYFPMIGILIAAAWSIPSVARLSSRRIVVVSGMLVVTIWALMAGNQVRYWRDSVTLFEHTLAVTQKNSLAHNNLGIALHERGDSRSAFAHLSESVRIDPDYSLAHYNLGVVLQDNGQAGRAISQFNEALRLLPDDLSAHMRLGAAHADIGQLDAAVAHFQAAVALAPESPDTHLNLGIALARKGDTLQANRRFQNVLRIDPANERAIYALASGLLELGNLSDARRHFEELIRIAPNFAAGHSGLGKVCLAEGERERAVEHLQEALRLEPRSLEARTLLQDLTPP